MTAYDLMLLADPGPSRDRVIALLSSRTDVRPDLAVENRYWLATSAGAAQVNIGTKDPVESIHVEFDFTSVEMLRAVAEGSLAIAGELGMSIEDVQWGHALHAGNLEELIRSISPRAAAPAPAPQRPRWKLW